MMTKRLRRPEPSIELGEQKLRAAQTIDALEDAWGLYCSSFADETSERAHLLGVYQDCAARMAVELSRYMRAG